MTTRRPRITGVSPFVMGRPPCRSHKLAHYTARRGRASRAHPPSSSVWTFPPSLKKPSHWPGLLRQPVSAQKLRPNAQPVSAEPATSAQAVATQPVTAQHVTAQHVDEKVAYEAPHGQDEGTIPYQAATATRRQEAVSASSRGLRSLRLSAHRTRAGLRSVRLSAETAPDGYDP